MKTWLAQVRLCVTLWRVDSTLPTTRATHYASRRDERLLADLIAGCKTVAAALDKLPPI